MSEELNQQYLLFAPKSARGLKVDYPELVEHEEFKVLRQTEILFVWFYACKSSPYFNSRRSDLDIIKICVEASGYKLDDEKRKAKFMAGNFPEKIHTAIKLMNEFEPSARIQAKLMSAKMVDDIKKLISLDLDENGNHPQFINKDGEVDFTKKKQYMEMVVKANRDLGDMVKAAESGFSITTKKQTVGDKNKDDSGDSYAESFHNN